MRAHSENLTVLAHRLAVRNNPLALVDPSGMDTNYAGYQQGYCPASQANCPSASSMPLSFTSNLPSMTPNDLETAYQQYAAQMNAMFWGNVGNSFAAAQGFHNLGALSAQLSQLSGLNISLSTGREADGEPYGIATVYPDAGTSAVPDGGGGYPGGGAGGPGSSGGSTGACESQILNATNNRFGTNYTDANVNSTFNYSTGAPPGQGTLNLNIYGSTAGVSIGYYPVHWWTYAIGYGPTLHIVSGPGGHGGLDSQLTLPFGPNQATFHWLLNITKAGGYPQC